MGSNGPPSAATIRSSVVTRNVGRRGWPTSVASSASTTRSSAASVGRQNLARGRSARLCVLRLLLTTRVRDLSSVRKALQRRKTLVAHTIYECGGCGERFLGERRCGDCNLFARAVSLGGVCPECDTTVLIADLLGEGVVPAT
jgi:hypothetical protein